MLLRAESSLNMSDETSQPEETTKKTREAAEQSRALDTLTDHVRASWGCLVQVLSLKRSDTDG